MTADPADPVIVGAGEARYRRRPGLGVTTHTLLRDAVLAALRQAGLEPADVDGLAVSSFSLAPDHAVDLAWRLGLSLRWLLDDCNGGASGLNMLGHARAAIRAGDASVVVIVSGDRQDPDGIERRQASFNRATRDHLAPLAYGGPNALFAMLTQRQMARYGLERTDYGGVVISQRRWAVLNPGAVYRTPLTMDAYLDAPMIASPLHRLDCVPSVSGADALVVAGGPRRGPAVRIRSIVRSFNPDQQGGDGLQTPLAVRADEMWATAGAAPGDVDLACVYDDYPAMVLAQLCDVGLVPGDDLVAFVRRRAGDPAAQFPVNTSGGMLSCGQAGAAGGLHGLVEAVRQLQHRAGGRQVARARLALVTGYGMMLYRYGAAAGAAILERAG